MAKEPKSPERRHIGKTYFYDFVERVEDKYPHASLVAILEEIAFARTQPALAGMSRTADGFLQLSIVVGYSRVAVIELEYDDEGRLQPLTGEIA